MLEIVCPRCGAKHHADEQHIGKSLRCARCGDAVQIGSQAARPLQSRTTWSQSIHRAHPSPVRVLAGGSRKRFVLFGSLILMVMICGLLLLRRGNDSQRPESVNEASGLNKRSGATSTYGPNRGVEQEHKVEILPEANSSAPVGQPKSLPTGTRLIRDSALGGRGKLEIINGTPYDAEVRVIDADTGVRDRDVYIDKEESTTLRHLAPGTYYVCFTTGSAWGGIDRGFANDARYIDFGRQILFSEHTDESADKKILHHYYDEASITLNPVPYGNVHSETISKEQFEALTEGKRSRPAIPVARLGSGAH